jgi:hypothetical protein
LTLVGAGGDVDVIKDFDSDISDDDVNDDED